MPPFHHDVLSALFRLPRADRAAGVERALAWVTAIRTAGADGPLALRPLEWEQWSGLAHFLCGVMAGQTMPVTP